ncbi:MAG: DUF3109 family protein [Bernardetiaceae bacterium]
MYIVQNQYISDDIAERHFVCQIAQCKGACCQQGDLGAPLETDEMAQLKADYASIAPFLSPEGQAVIEQEGCYILDEENDYSTPLITSQENQCAYALKDERGHWSCGIEKAYLNGATNFRKPISCHLYPIRITQHPRTQSEALNYDRWDICAPACQVGEAGRVPMYVFLEAALVRRYGRAWYDELVQQIETHANGK